MTLSRINPSTWGVGDKLSSTQVNGIDANVTNALDKRNGQADTLGSVVSQTSGGRMVPQVLVGTDASTIVFVGNGGNIVVPAGTLTAARQYTLSTTGAFAGDSIYIRNLSTTYPISVVDASSSTILVLLGASGTAAELVSASFLFDGTRWDHDIAGRKPVLQSGIFTASGTWTCPPGVYFVSLYGWGAGGGGGAGGNAIPSNGNVGTCSGGGGGAARPQTRMVPVTPGTTYVVTIGGGGAGAAGGSNAPGSDGGDTTFDVLATFRGAAGGQAQPVTSTLVFYAIGGATVKGAIALGAQHGWEPGLGGYGTSLYNGGSGNPSLEGFVGGLTSAAGFTTGTSQGGGGGGGGGGGPAGVGGAGGQGGNGATSGGSSGNGGGSGAANSGAGGGGGGGGGSCPTGGATAGLGGYGGIGGSGYLMVVPMR